MFQTYGMNVAAGLIALGVSVGLCAFIRNWVEQWRVGRTLPPSEPFADGSHTIRHLKQRVGLAENEEVLPLSELKEPLTPKERADREFDALMIRLECQARSKSKP